MSGINGSMAHLSDTLFTTAIAVYALAAVGFTAEYSFGRRELRAGSRTVRARELVGAGGPPVSEPVAPAAPVSSERGSFGDRIGRFSVAVVVIGAIVHAASIAVRGIAVDAVPWSNMYEFANVAGLVGVIAFLGVVWKAPGIRRLGGFILLPAIVLMFLAGTVWYSQAAPLVPALRSYWLAIHVTLAAVSEGALMTSAVLTVLYLIKARHDKKPGTGTLARLAERLPAATALDKAAYRVVAFSFPLYTVAIICGAIWAEAAWGRYWGWDPKETWAFIVWVVYAGYLHARATAGWKGNKAAYVNLLGFFSITFNFLVVNIVVSGLHSYAGLS
ncbi:MAG: c-type cytochrome biogenesis protein CcsB [Jatrophihabitans sp.]|uniref:c-type cytochrome biogenesis protein CcsB n=1 Tax=Jatrophihabitans sp. TaxID=1932789 RepID=UPI003F7CFBF1